MESTSCNVCHADDFAVLFEGPDRLHHLPGIFRLVCCRRCGLIYLNPRPDCNEIHQFYPEDYLAFQRAIEDDRSFLKRLDRRYGIYKRCRAVIKEQPLPGRILDIGCATGLFLFEMKKKGWETLGIDLSESASGYARKRMGLKVITGDFLEVELPPRAFDVITLWDVLEHLPTPGAALEKITGLLRENGLLLLNLPNPGSWEAGFFGPCWIGWDPPRHLNLFSLPQIIGLMKEHHLVYQRVVAVTGEFFGLKVSLKNLLQERLPLKPLAVKTLLALLTSPLSRVLAIPFYALANPTRMGTNMTIFARFQRQ
jgi:2-polyprenyl-3-methyl-5-hydroxy-6-metoxy-1,4-benzoquinol methylase